MPHILKTPPWIALIAPFCLALTLAQTLWGVEHVSIRQDGKDQYLDGKVLVEAADGGLLLADRMGKIWAIQPEEILRREADQTPYEPLDAAAMEKQLITELSDSFRTHTTAHYVICHNTSSAYAQWCGALFERLYGAFHNYWKNRGFELSEPEGPLIALVFDNKTSYGRYAKPELGEATSAVPGYYSMTTNRVAMYDLTGAARAGGGRVSTSALVNRILARPEATGAVATIIHEATHQLAYNCGLETRFADVPLWSNEGLAVYFETPDLNSSRGWRNIGGVNPVRLRDFQRYLARRPADSLRTLLATDERFRNTRTAQDAYAEAWALHYFLIRKHSDEFLRYMRVMSGKQPLRYDEPETRLGQFEATFGDLESLDAEFLRYMRSVR